MGHAAPSIIVPLTLKTMTSAPGEALASIIACRYDPVPEPPKLETVKVAALEQIGKEKIKSSMTNPFLFKEETTVFIGAR
ncbi:MAG: hypothetical protein Crog4KO_08740 [Crocinitomicaceae bacterium]